MKLQLAQIQSKVYKKQEDTLDHIGAQIHKLMERQEQPDLVMLGEMFACPYGTEYFTEYGQKEGESLYQALGALAKQYGIYLVAGSVPELDQQGHIYNTSYIFNREGQQIGKHRKIHLFDVDIQNGQYFKESDTLTPGNGITVFDTEFGKMGVCICFDIRFPDLIRDMALAGARVILVPAAFNLTTGPAHWDVLFRARAIDQQCFIAGTSTARDETADYKAYGHSILVSPWGNVMEEMDEKEGSMVHQVNLEEVEKMRKELPVFKEYQ